ncbi:hypothetical protein J1605_018295 [Eschrichtius robustus]|uniref:Uncharacterized protein n=1 Tax=Eschrichtius robustus TaxID=9764 RepID=A0AB34HVU2_ESCRO|nr:hypothetical protein J1605_018295 [Eschrichtius robustus]
MSGLSGVPDILGLSKSSDFWPEIASTDDEDPVPSASKRLLSVALVSSGHRVRLFPMTSWSGCPGVKDCPVNACGSECECCLTSSEISEGLASCIPSIATQVQHAYARVCVVGLLSPATSVACASGHCCETALGGEDGGRRPVITGGTVRLCLSWGQSHSSHHCLRIRRGKILN